MSESEDLRKAIKQKAVALLAIRERSRSGLEKKLAECFEEADADLIRSVLDELAERKYQSDSRFARVRIMTRASRYGDRRLRTELRREGIDDESIDEAFEEFKDTEIERAAALWERKFGYIAEDDKERAKQFRYLASRGFSFRTIEKVMRGKTEDDE